MPSSDMSVPFSFLSFLLHSVIRTHGQTVHPVSLSLSRSRSVCLSLSSPLVLSCCCGQQENGAGTGPGNWELETRNWGWRPLRTDNVTGVLVQYWQTVQYKERPDQEPNGSYTFFVGPLGFGAACRAWAVQAKESGDRVPARAAVQAGARQARNPALATAVRRREGTQGSGRQEHLAACSLHLAAWGSAAMEGQGNKEAGWVGA